MASRSSVLEATVDLVTEEELTDRVFSHRPAARPFVVGHHNLHSVALSRRDAAMRAFYERADMIYVDGMSLITVARFLGLPARREHRLTSVDWLRPVLEHARSAGWRVYYLGSDEATLVKALATLRADLPGLAIEGRNGHFDMSTETDEVLAGIAAFRPDILFVGMGMPRQEHWVLHNADRIPASVVWTVGACLDYVGGLVPTAPRGLARLGGEWLFRLAVEPRRLWRRYLVEPWSLLPLLLRQMWAQRVRRQPGGAR
jgi:N-acetylglucosaminyldiphosphoundecaprenol N-acetyl-beta-D-mannosaminyltransferase